MICKKKFRIPYFDYFNEKHMLELPWRTQTMLIIILLFFFICKEVKELREEL